MHKKKSSKTASKLLAAVIAAAMSLTMLPATAMAVEGSTRAGEGGLVLNKTATLENDGTYTIQLEAFSTGETLTVMKQTPTDIVLVLDVSGSMKEQLDNTLIDDGYVPATGKVSDKPTDVYHHCPDGTYSTVKWTDERNRLGTGHIRFTCDHCGVRRSLNYTFGIASPSQIEDQDGWALYKKGSHYAYKLEVLQMAAKQFIQEVATRNAAIDDPNNQHRVSIVKFASEKNNEIGNGFNGSGYNYTQIVDGLTVIDSEAAEKLNADIDSFSAAGATSVDYGMEYAKSILDPVRSADRKQVVIVFTDGAPTHSNSFEGEVANSAIGTAKSLKSNDVSIYTIGVFDNADPNDTSASTNAYMNAMSSNYPEASSYTSLGQGSNQGYYKVAASTAELNDIFTSISEDVNYSNVTLNADAVIKDIMGNGFVLTDKSNATAYSVPYTGMGADGNRTFGTSQTPYTATISIDDRTVSVTGFDYSKKYLVDSAPVQGEKLVVTITGVEAVDITETDKAVNTNDALSGIYEKADSANPAAVFPIPQTIFKSKAFVLDYAKPVTLSAFDWNMTSTTKIGGNMAANQAAVSAQYGNAVVESGSSLTYTPDTMAWGGYDSFYVFGKTTDLSVKAVEANKNGNLWSKISLLPANNVYFEDTFDTISYAGDWSTDGTSAGNTETANNAVHGWIASMADDETYSDGTAAYSNTANSTATFTFTGTGVDVYSRTNSGTGYVKAQLSQNGKLIKSQVVNSQSVSGDYYQIPTISFSGLEHGTYTVKLTVGTDANYYLDGIRVYNPLSESQEKDPVVSVAYGDEIGAIFTEVRDVLLDEKSFGTTTEGAGAVFLDKQGISYSVAEYEDYGPKNEVYLKSDADHKQAIVFNVGDPNANYYIGLKAPAGATKATVTDGDGKTKDVNIDAASDLYYAITPTSKGMIEIKNTGTNLLSITKLRRTGDASDAEVFGLLRVSDAVAYANSFDSLSNISDGDSTVTEPETPEISKPDRPGHNKPQQKPGYHKDWFKNLFHGFGDWFRG